jgi:sec-independent protein translocase protein TatA
MNILATLFNLGGPDLIVILLIVLLLFGAKKLPELARGMGQAFREFNKAKDEFEREVAKPVNDLAVQPAPNTLAQKTGEAASAAPPPAAPATQTPAPESTPRQPS